MRKKILMLIIPLKRLAILQKLNRKTVHILLLKNNKEEFPSDDQKVRILKRLPKKEQLLYEVKVKKEFNEEELMKIQAQNL